MMHLTGVSDKTISPTPTASTTSCQC